MIDAIKLHCARWSYEGVDFPAAESDTEGGHDSATNSPYLDVPEIQTTGPKAYTASVQIPLHEGVKWPSPLFPLVYRDLVRKFEDVPLGLLTHPTRGTFIAHVDSWRESQKSQVRSGVVLTVQFREQRRSSEVLDFSVGAEGDPGEKALAYAAEVDTATPDDVTVDATALSMVTAALDSLEASRRTRLQASATFDALFVDLATRVADPDAQAASAHAYRYALWRTRAAMLAYQARYLGTSAPRRYTVPVTMSVHQLAALPEVFGDIARARELLDANAILDPCEVPAGTVLLVVD